MTNRSSPPPPPAPLHGTVRPDDGEILVDVTDAALTRLVELIRWHPGLLGALARASGHSGPARLGVVLDLRADPDVRAACTVRLSREDAAELAAELAAAIIAAATSPVGAATDRETDPLPSPGRTPR